MKISIVMATYNGEKFILEQLESFISQTRQPDELIITDDCSSDGTIDILKKFKRNAPFEVKIFINKTNLGYIQNFNKALELCTGDFVFLSDQDDVWFPTKIDYMIELTVSHPDKALYMIDARLTDEELEESEFTKQGQIKDLGLDERAFVMGCCICIKKDFLMQILPIPKNFFSHDMWLVLIADMLDLRYIDSSIQQYYRIHLKNTSTFVANSLIKMKKLEKQKVSLKKKVFTSLGSSKTLFLKKLIEEKRVFLAPLKCLLKQQQYYLVIEPALDNIQNEIEVITKRLEVTETKKFIERIQKALKLYLSGGYESFSGFKSCVIDIIRR